MKTLADELNKYAAGDYYPFHMPGHKRHGSSLYTTDITEIDGFDNLHDPEGIILEEMKYAADFYGTKDTFFSVNGSTCGILAAISAAVPRGGRLLIERGCHISVYHAACLRNLELEYIDGTGTIETPDAIVITSPSYEGCCGNVASWAQYARHWNIPLIVDEAHGAHFSMHPYFPESAIRLGADIVIQSTHKTLPAMTQTALIHNVTGRIDSAAIQKYLDIYESSSPSYVLLASITSAIHLCSEFGSTYFDAYAEQLKELRSCLSGMKHLKLLGGADAILKSDREFPPFREGTVIDPGKIVIRRSNHLSGPELYARLRDEYHLQPEMKAPNYCLLMTSVADTEEGFERLKQALLEIDASQAEIHTEDNHFISAGISSVRSACLPPVRMRISEAVEVPSEILPLREAIGRISADYICVYPPDSPLLVPGEEFTEECADQIINLINDHLTVTGLINDGSVELFIKVIK